MKVTRSMFQRYRQLDAIATTARNKRRKGPERDRRTARMMKMISAGSLPYTPVVMSWLSRELGKPASKITPEDIKSLQG